MDTTPRTSVPEPTRPWLMYAVLLIAFGIFLPWRKGLDFFDPVLLSAYACIGMVFAGPAAAQAFENRPRSMAQALGWILAAVGLGEFIAVAMLVAGFITVRVTHTRLLFGPDFQLLGYGLLLGLMGCIALAALAAWLAVRFSSRLARLM